MSAGLHFHTRSMNLFEKQCFSAFLRGRSRNGWPNTKGWIEMLHTRGCFADCSIISSNWSTSMSQNSRPVCWRWITCGESFSSTGYGTSRIGPERGRIQGGSQGMGEGESEAVAGGFRMADKPDASYAPAPI